MSKSQKVNAWYGLMPDLPDYLDKLYSAIAAPPRRLPPAVDLRAMCSAVENQGPLGSCTANALVGNLEFLEKKAGQAPADLSRLFVYYNERAMEGTVNEDAGAMIRDGVKTLVNQGVCTEMLWPYVIARFAAKPPAAAVTLFDAELWPLRPVPYKIRNTWSVGGPRSMGAATSAPLELTA